MSAYESQAAHAPLPGAPLATITVPNASSSAAVDLSAAAGKWVNLKADTKTHFRAGESGVGEATADDYWLTADMAEPFKVVPGRTHIRVFGASAAGKCVVVVTDVP